MRQRIITGGVPYALHIKRLQEAWPADKLTEGLTLTHEQLEGALNLPAKSQRYYGVINSWMTKLRNETGIFLAWEVGDGVKVLTPAQVLGHAETRTRQKLKQTGRAIRTFAWVDRERLDAKGQARLDHQTRVATALKAALDKTRQEMAVELAPVQSLPKRIAANG